MVLRTFSNFTKCKNAGFSFSRNASTQTYTHQFFNPSYISPKELIKVDEVGFKGRSQKQRKSTFKYVAPALSITQNYVVLEPSKRDEKSEKKIRLRKSSHVGNKNNHLNITVESITNTHTTISIRRSNSTNVKTLILPNKSTDVEQRRSYSTDTLERDLANLNIEDTFNIKGQKQEEINAYKTVKKVETIENISNVKQVKFNFNDSKISNFNSVNEALDTFLYENPKNIQEKVIDNMIACGKNNEVLPAFLRLRNLEIIPSIDTYNKVLRAIQMRETDETSEEKLTHLLNIYSDMLSNNLKPNEKTYELVIEPLLKGSLKYYEGKNFKDGYDFYKIAMELFMISHGNENTNIKFKNNSIYINLLTALNYYKAVNAITPQILNEKLKDKIDNHNLIEFYTLMMEFGGLSKDEHFVNETYNNLKNLPLDKLNNNKLMMNQHQIYMSLIQALNNCGNNEKALKTMNIIFAQIDKRETIENQQLMSKYISVYLKSESNNNPIKAFESFEKFNKTMWLPKISIGSLLYLTSKLIQINNFQLASKVWDNALSRADFDNSFKSFDKLEGSYFATVSVVYDQYVEMALASQNLNLVMKAVYETLSKNSLVLNDITLVKLLTCLQQTGYYEFAGKLVLDQGYKKSISGLSLNTYLSTIVDYLLPHQYMDIAQSKLFKKVIEQYRLVKDNIYGVMKIFKFAHAQLEQNNDEKLRLKLKYYAKVLDFEFNDLDNTYVKLPQDLTNFKAELQRIL
ncbi:ribonuclease P [Martiniozyma asiatica (nom. inval.)]|nr:ribonuclease P [Martiniozyma asiatica]